MLKKIKVLFILMILIYILTEWVIRGLYWNVLRFDYIIFHLPFVHVTKYFFIAFIFFIFFKRYGQLTSAGEKIVPIFLIISAIGIVVTSLCFTLVTEKKLVNYRTVWWDVHEWNEVDYVKTEIIVKDPSDRMKKKSPFSTSKRYEKYYVYFEDGSVINAWENVDAVYQLHHLVLNKQIDVIYTREPEEFEVNYKLYFKKDMPKAKFIFLGMDEERSPTEK